MIRNLSLALPALLAVLIVGSAGPAQAAPSDYFDIVQKCYIGYYQRPADPGGLVWWAERLDEVSGNLNSIIEAFAKSEESKALYGEVNNTTISNVVDGIYMGLLSRTASQVENDYWSGLFKEGKISSAAIMLIMLNGAQNEDLTTINNKLTAANLFTRAVDPELDGVNPQYDYSDAIAPRARSLLSTVTSDPSTIPTGEEITAFFVQVPAYNTTVLNVSGWTDLYLSSINDRGEVVGGGKAPEGDMRILDYRNGSFAQRSYQGWTDIFASAINDSDKTVGYGLTSSEQYMGWVDTDNGHTVLLPQGWTESYGVDVNSAGQVAGWGVDSEGQTRAFLYSNGVYTTLLPQGWTDSYAVSINDSGQVVGMVTEASAGLAQAFLYSNGVYTTLLPQGWTESYGVDVNSAGQVAGWGVDSEGQTRAFLYSNGVYTTLLPQGWTDSYAVSINDSGQVVGMVTEASAGLAQAFLYSNGVYTTLLPQGWTDSYAVSINDSGQVVGGGFDASCQQSVFAAFPQ